MAELVGGWEVYPGGQQLKSVTNAHFCHFGVGGILQGESNRLGSLIRSALSLRGLCLNWGVYRRNRCCPFFKSGALCQLTQIRQV